jgi:perosamine synthetase
MNTEIVDRIVEAVRQVLGSGNHPLHEPCFKGNELRYLGECVDSTFVSSVGKYTERFENQLAEYTGAKRVVAVVNGTSALQVALRLAGVGQGDEVMMPALTFVATANAVSYLGAVPHFADSNESSLGLDPGALREQLVHCAEKKGDGCYNRRTGRKISAVVPMHTFGHPCDMAGLIAVASEFGLAVVEDAAESLGSFYASRHTGTFGLFGTLSFNGNKTITTGGGGAILTNDDKLADLARHLTTTAKVAHPWEYIHDETGYNFRMPNLNAALGCAQLEQLPDLLAAKRNLYERYKNAFAGIEGIEVFTEPAKSKSNYWLQTLVLDEKNSNLKDKILEATNNAGFMTRPAWRLLHKLPMYRNCPRSELSVAESLEFRIINLPSSAKLP